MRKFIFILLFPQLLTTKFRRRGSDLYNYFLLNIQVIFFANFGRQTTYNTFLKIELHGGHGRRAKC